MSQKLPIVKSKDLIKVAKKLEFEFDRQSGSHAIYYRRSDKKRIVIPIHTGKDIKPKTLHGIIKDMGISIDEFKKIV